MEINNYLCCSIGIQRKRKTWIQLESLTLIKSKSNSLAMKKTNTKDIKLDEKDKVNNKIFDFKRKFTNCKWGYLNKSLIAATEDGALLTINLAGEIVNEV